MLVKIWNKKTEQYIAKDNITYIFNDIDKFVLESRTLKRLEYSKKVYDLDFIHA